MHTHNPSSETIFALLRACLWGEQTYPFTTNSDVDWDTVYKELCQQTIQNLPIEILCRSDSVHKSLYLQNVSRKVRKWYHLMQEQNNLYRLLQSAGIKVVILKGSSANYYYPQPTYRSMGDVDLLVKKEDAMLAYQLMRENNYQIIKEEGTRHTGYIKNNIVFELHYCFSTKQHTTDELLDKFIFSAFDNIQEQSLENYIFPMLPAMENGLVLLEHIRHHLLSGLGLRQIIDWMLYVDKELNDEKWYSEFAPMVRQVGLETLAIITTKMCQIYLGLSDEISWCKNGDEKACQDLMDYVLESGNFGRKRDSKSNKTLVVLSNMRKNTNFFSRLQEFGGTNWKAIKKYPFLKPFAWIYQIIRYIRLGMQREQPLKSLHSDIKKSQKQEEFLHRLGIH